MRSDEVTERLRLFNRFYTQQLGLMTDRYLGQDRPLAEARVLYEIGREGIPIRDLRRKLGLDSAYLSRVLRALERATITTPDSVLREGMDRDSLVEVLGPSLRGDTVKSLRTLPSQIDPKLLPIPLVYNPSELRLEIPLEIELRSREELGLLDDHHRRYAAEALRPAPIGGALNYRLEQNWATSRTEGDFPESRAGRLLASRRSTGRPRRRSRQAAQRTGP
jgi:hypothetical protein